MESTDQNSNNESQQDILQKIKSGEVGMHSKSYFVWRNVLWLLALLILAAVGVFVVSFVVFALKASGVGDLPQYGLHGLREFLVYFPWLLVPAVLLFIWLIERFVRQYTFGYRLPVLYSALGVIVVIILASWVVLTTSLHDRLYQFAQQERLPLAGPMYKFFGASHHPDDLFIGRVTIAAPNLYNIVTREGQAIVAVTDKNTHFFSPSPIAAGDFVEIIGEENGNKVAAFDVRKIDPKSTYPMHLPRRP